jgi:hypothetical protein
VNARRNVPNVDGAFTPGSTLCTAPSRNTPKSSMLSAPVTIPAMIEATFPPGSNPAPPGTVNLFVTNACRPARRASRITGTSPAEPIRFGSSKVAATVGIWDSCISRMAFSQGFGDFSNHHFPRSEAIRAIPPRRIRPFWRWIQA